MFRFIFIFSFFLSLSNIVFAQGKKSSERAFLRLTNDNDFYKMRDGTDQYYTNGLFLEYQPKNTNRDLGIRRIFPKLTSSQATYTQPRYGFGMLTYTPLNAYDTTNHLRDRPYAGWAYLSAGAVSNDAIKGERLTTTYSIGMLGPMTRQGAMQIWFHESTKRKVPKGWDKQIANDLALNCNLVYERMLWNPASPLEFVAIADANCGSVMNYASVGGMFRLGFMNDYFSAVSGLSPKATKLMGRQPTRRVISENLNRKMQMYFYAKGLGRAALDNSLLEGGYLNFKNSPYKLRKADTNKFYAQYEFGYVFATRYFSILFSQTFRTKEFKLGEATQWGTVGIVVGM
jgi:lipid A 3-O-deacylase